MYANGANIVKNVNSVGGPYGGNFSVSRKSTNLKTKYYYCLGFVKIRDLGYGYRVNCNELGERNIYGRLSWRLVDHGDVGIHLFNRRLHSSFLQ
jgi:hypothetical protein